MHMKVCKRLKNLTVNGQKKLKSNGQIQKKLNPGYNWFNRHQFTTFDWHRFQINWSNRPVRSLLTIFVLVFHVNLFQSGPMGGFEKL